jgi:hypothetical protein
MRKTRIMIQLGESDLARLDADCKEFGCSRPVAIETALRSAWERGLDLSSGQARELADAIGGRK